MNAQHKGRCLIFLFQFLLEIREEAVREALQKEPLICLESLRPSKRRQQTTCIPEPGPSHARSKRCLSNAIDSFTLPQSGPLLYYPLSFAGESESETSLDTSSQRCPQTSNPLPVCLLPFHLILSSVYLRAQHHCLTFVPV